VLTHPALQLAVEHRPESTDQGKIENTASHVLETISEDKNNLVNGFFPASKVAGT
jgi:hypothetical protein